MPELFTFDEIAKATAGDWVSAAAGGSASSVTTDSRKDAAGALFIAIPGESFDGHDYLESAVKMGAAALCVERAKAHKLPPGVPAIAVESTVSAYQALANFHRRRFKDLKVAALTGSSGKTSTKEMIRAVLNSLYGPDATLATEGNTNNHVGVPQNLLRLTSRHRACVIEMGSNHHGEIEPLSKAAEPDVALIVSIGRCHLEHFGSLEGVAKEKSSIFKHLRPGGAAVIPASGNGVETLVAAARGRKLIRFGKGEGSSVVSHYLGGSVTGSSFILEDLSSGERAEVSWSLSGRHQSDNAAGAAAAAMALTGASLQEVAKGLSSCSLPGMRAKVSEILGATWINDAYNANPDSMKATLEWLSEFASPQRLALGLGDMREIGEGAVEAHIEILQFALSKFPGARIAAVGQFMGEALSSLGRRDADRIVHFPDAASAAAEFPKIVRPGDIVFLKASRGTRLELLEPRRT